MNRSQGIVNASQRSKSLPFSNSAKTSIHQPENIKKTLRMKRKIPHMFAALLLGANLIITPLPAQSTSSASFWTGAVDGNWDTVGNWNFGASNQAALLLPQAQASSNRGVLFTDEAAYPTANRNITLASSIDMQNAYSGFAVRNGEFTIDLNGKNAVLQNIVLGSSAGGIGKVAFTNSSQTPSEVSIFGFNIWTDGTEGNNSVNLGTMFGPNVNLVWNPFLVYTSGSFHLDVKSTAGGIYNFDMGGISAQISDIIIGANTSDTLKLHIANSSANPSTLAFHTLRFRNTSGYGSSAKWSDLFGAGVSASTVLPSGIVNALEVQSTNGADFSFDLEGHSVKFLNLYLGASSSDGGSMGKVSFTNSGAPATFVFREFQIWNAAAYGNSLDLGEFFGQGITAQQEDPQWSGNRFRIFENGGQDLQVDVNGIEMGYLGGMEFGQVGPIGKVTFVNSGAPSKFYYASLRFDDMSGYGATFSASDLFGPGITPVPGPNMVTDESSGYNFYVGKTAPSGVVYDLEGVSRDFGTITIGSGEGRTAKLSLTNSSADEVDVRVRGLTLGASGSAGNEISLSELFGTNVNGTLEGASLYAGVRITVGSDGGGINNELSLDDGNTHQAAVLTVNSGSDDSPSNNRIILENQTVLDVIDKTTDFFKVNGSYYVDENNRTNNQFVVRDGANLLMSGTVARRMFVSKGSEFRIENGGLVANTSTGYLTFDIEADAFFKITGEGSLFQKATGTGAGAASNLYGHMSVTAGAEFSYISKITMYAGSSLLVDGAYWNHKPITTGGSDIAVLDVSGKATFQNEAVAEILGTQLSGAGRPVVQVKSGGLLEVKGNSSLHISDLGPVQGLLTIEEGSTFIFNNIGRSLSGSNSALAGISGIAQWGTGSGQTRQQVSSATSVMPVGSNLRLVMGGGTYSLGTSSYPGRLVMAAGSSLEGSAVFNANSRIESSVGGFVINPGVNHLGTIEAGKLEFQGTQGIQISAAATGAITMVFDVLSTETFDQLLTANFVSATAPVVFDIQLRTTELAAGDSFKFMTGGEAIATRQYNFSQSEAILTPLGLKWDVSNFAATGVLTIVPMNAVDAWRQQWFGTTADIGIAADDMAPAGDGVSNLLKYATTDGTVDPASPGRMPGELELDGESLVFTYPRNKAAVGVVNFEVKWSDTLQPESWSSAGVVETGTQDLGDVENVTVSIPKGTGTKRFVRLEVTSN